LGIICGDWHHELGGPGSFENGQGCKKGNGTMKKKLEIGLVAILCLLLWATEVMTGWFSSHFPSWFFQTVWGVTLVVYVIIPAGQIWLKGEHHECH